MHLLGRLLYYHIARCLLVICEAVENTAELMTSQRLQPPRDDGYLTGTIH